VAYLIIAFSFGLAGGIVGRSKGSSFLIWFLIAFAIPVVGLVAAVLYRSGWEAAAREVAERAGIAQDLVAPMPDGPLTDPAPSSYDVAVLLGSDRR
jgi:hypothetical protein